MAKRHIKYEYEGKLYTVPELAELANIGKSEMYKRLAKMSVTDAVNYVAPKKNSSRTKLYSYCGTLVSVAQFSKIINKSTDTIYKYIKRGMSLEEIENYINNRIPTNNRIPKKYNWCGQDLTVLEIASLTQIDSSNLYRRLQEGYDINEAIEFIQNNQTKKYPYKGTFCSRAQILKSDNNISPYKLYMMLKSDVKYTEEEVKFIISLCIKSEKYMVGNKSLFQYCIDNQYNYSIIYYLIKHCNYSIDNAISHYLNCGQGDPSHGKYFVGNILLNHFCIKDCLDISYIRRLLQDGYNVNQVIKRHCFNRNQTYATRKQRLRLCAINEVWEISTTDIKQLIEKHYSLSEKDLLFMKQCNNKAWEIIKDYDLYRLSYYLERSEYDIQVKQFLLTNDLSIDNMLNLLSDIYDNFVPLSEKTLVKYKWKK